VEGGGRLTGHAVGGGGRRQCRFVERGGRGGCAAAGLTRGEGKRAGPKRNSKKITYSNNFQTSSSCFDPKVDYQALKILNKICI
jgi:hypothetical protein